MGQGHPYSKAEFTCLWSPLATAEAAVRRPIPQSRKVPNIPESSGPPPEHSGGGERVA